MRPPQIIIVEASAGSGKTYALAKRYIQLLINPEKKEELIPLNAILAITFTNKAALEMKERILEFLKRIALDKFKSKQDKENIFAGIFVSEESARRKAFGLMDALIRDYNFFQVQTIDSFINAVLSGCAFKLDLSANFKTETGYQEYLSYALDELIDRAGVDEKIAELFKNFLLQYIHIENKASWFPKKTILTTINGLFEKSNKQAGRFIRSKFEAEDILKEKQEFIKLAAELGRDIPDGTHGTFARSLEGFSGQNKESFDIDGLSKFFFRPDFPMTGGKDAPKKTEELWAKMRKNLARLSEMESASKFNYYVDIFNLAFADFSKKSRQEDVLFLEALNKEASALFNEKALGLPELYLRLATRFQHYLLDEFQDTSKLQWDNLEPMVLDAIGSGGTLFYVGDRKQAIYRFRGGDVGLIDKIKADFKDYSLQEEPLSKNYRSQKEIVEFNNAVFSEANLKRFLSKVVPDPDDVEEVSRVYKDAQQSHLPDKTAGYVKSEFIDLQIKEERDDALKEKLVSLLESLQDRYSPKDIAILARKNEQVKLLTSWLLEHKIPVESEKTLNVRENSYVKELVSFLKFLNSPIDNLSFASFILGDIFSAATGRPAQEMRDFIFNVSQKEKSGYLYREFRGHFPKIWDELLEEFFNSVGFVPLYELLIAVFNRYKIAQNFSGNQGFFMKFLELVKSNEEKHSSIGSFLEYFDKAQDDELYVNVTESNAIKILTIHKAKGLEFPVVIVPFFELGVKSEPEVILPQEGQLKLLYVKEVYGEFSLPLARILRDEFLKALIDELNNAYVALTRAAEELYIFVSPKVSNRKNLACQLLPETDFEKGKIRETKLAPRMETPVIKLAASVYKDWIDILKNEDEFAKESVLKERKKVEGGEVLHRILYHLGAKASAKELKNALEKTGLEFPHLSDLKEYGAIVEKLLKDEKLSQYLQVKDGAVYLEKEIVNSFGDTKRIDRLIVKDKEAMVIDYKSTRSKLDHYKEQVAEYMKIISSIYPKHKVRGILLYLDDLSTEEVNG